MQLCPAFTTVSQSPVNTGLKWGGFQANQSDTSVFSLSGQNDAPPSSTTPPFCFLPIRKILHQQTIHNTILPRNISKHGHQDVSTQAVSSVYLVNTDRYSFFDVTWEGPVMDASGKQTSKVAGKSLLSHSFFTIDHRHHYQQLHTWSRLFMFGAGINSPSPPCSHSKVVLTVDVVDDAVDALPHLAPAQ